MDRFIQVRRTRLVPEGNTAPQTAAPAATSIAPTNDGETETETAERVVESWTCSCGGQIVTIAAEATRVCENCGVSQVYQQHDISTIAHDGFSIVQRVPYQRTMHFMAQLKSVQAKEGRTVPQEVVDSISAIVRRNRMEPETVTPIWVRQQLKAMKLSQYYGSVVQIRCRVVGEDPPRITHAEELELQHLFQSIQGPFEKLIKEKFPQRKNLISYGLLLYKLCELKGHDHLLPGCIVPSDKSKTAERIWNELCKYMGCEIIDDSVF